MDLEIWVVFPETKGADTRAVRSQLRKECRYRSWQLQEKTSRMQRLNGRPRELVAGADAVNLYRRAHRVRMAVFVSGKPFVSLTPGMPRIGQTRSLTTFVRYKAHALRLPTETTQVSSHLDSCEAWHRGAACEGGHDPRCLPLHVFETRHTDLDEPRERRAFDIFHGTGARRQDDRGLKWRLDPTSFHGTERLHVAGHELPSGFHWDVSVQGGPKTLTTGTEEWKVFRYINIAPDAHFRGRRPHARRIKRDYR